MIVIAYHGTEQRNVAEISASGFNNSSDKSWFGQGVYFFESIPPISDGVIEAESWAKNIKKAKSWAIFERSIYKIVENNL